MAPVNSALISRPAKKKGEKPRAGDSAAARRDARETGDRELVSREQRAALRAGRGFLSSGNAGIRSRNSVLANEPRDALEIRSTAASCPRQLPARRAKQKEISGRGKGNESSQRAEGNARES